MQPCGLAGGTGGAVEYFTSASLATLACPLYGVFAFEPVG